MHRERLERGGSLGWSVQGHRAKSRVGARRMYFDALEAHASGELPFGLDQKIDYRAIRTLAMRFPQGTDWRQLDLKAPPAFEFRLAEAG
jgi:hypothetical protein